MRVGFLQFKPAFGKILKNLSLIIRNLNGVTADIIVLPELPFTGYLFQNREEVRNLSEEISSSSVIDALTVLCSENKFYLVTGFAELAGERCYNSAVLIGPEGVVSVYRKLHLFNMEKEWFDPGDIPLTVHEIRDAKIGMMVCFDWIFPEVTRTLALQGADIICHPSNLVLNYCQHTMISRCIENNVYAITANRFGSDDRYQRTLRFTGKSQIVAPKGQLLFRAPSQRQLLYLCDIDLTLSRNKMITDLNHAIDDRRPEFYKDICKRKM